MHCANYMGRHKRKETQLLPVGSWIKNLQITILDNVYQILKEVNGYRDEGNVTSV